MRRLNRYLLRRTLPPMGAVLFTTMVAFLMERLLRSFDLLAQSSRGFDFLVQLAVNLTPHYLGLTLPGGFFIALFIVVNRLNGHCEVDAILTSGISMSQFMAPFVGLGLTLMLLSIALYGFIQPYSRYAYRAVLHAAENAGWNGEVRAGALLTAGPDLLLTAEATDPTGQNLERVFIRRVDQDGGEADLTATSARVRRNLDNQSVTLELRDGQQLSTTAGREPAMLTFSLLTLRVPLAPTASLLRRRGGEESELTLLELAQQGFQKPPPVLPRQTVLAELYSRMARAIALPLMPLLAIPLGLTAKRAGSSPAMAVAGVLLFSFQSGLVLAQGLAANGRISAAAAEGGPAAVFAAACIGTFLLSRKRPGENPVNWAAERLSDAIAFVARRGRKAAAAR